MKSKLNLRMFFLAICMMAAGTASAAITGYVSNPTANSLVWANAVTNCGATINTSVNFDGIAGTGAVTPAIGGFYSGTAGVTFSASNINLAATMSPKGAIPSAARVKASGRHRSYWLRISSVLGDPSPERNVHVPKRGLWWWRFPRGFGGACQGWTISARDTNNVSLGSFQSLAGAGFQNTNVIASPHKYFMGISNTEDYIASLTISRPAMSMFTSGDIVGIDDFRFAVAAPPVPEPAEWAMLVAGLLVVGFIARRRNNFA